MYTVFCPIAQTNLKLTVLLPQLPECRDTAIYYYAWQIHFLNLCFPEFLQLEFCN